MATPDDWVLQQAIVDVQYERGMVYLDRCGSLLLTLEDTLGKPFVGAVPTMDHAELRNNAERIVIQYGQRNFNLTQNWVLSPARVEQLAPTAWEKVGETLGVSRHASRCGVRFVLLSKAATLKEAQERVARCPLGQLSDGWRQVCGTGAVRSASVVVEDQRGRARIAVEGFELKIDGLLPADLQDVVPSFAVALDIDNVHPESGKFQLQKTGLKEFIRSSWQRAQGIAKLVRTGHV